MPRVSPTPPRRLGANTTPWIALAAIAGGAILVGCPRSAPPRPAVRSRAVGSPRASDGHAGRKALKKVHLRSLAYTLTQAGHHVLREDFLRLSTRGTRCFRARFQLFESIFFPAGRADLPASHRPRFLPALAGVTAYLTQKRAPDAILYVHGHADRAESRSARHARTLSRARAEHVRRWLVSRGAPAARLRIVVHGWALSARRRDTPIARRRHRRVSFSNGPTPTSFARSDRGPPAPAEVRRALAMALGQLGAVQHLSPPIGLHAATVVITATWSDGRQRRWRLGALTAPPPARRVQALVDAALAARCRWSAVPQ